MAGRDFGENLAQRVSELVETLRSVSQPLANTRKDVAEAVGVRVNELTESLKTLSAPCRFGVKTQGTHHTHTGDENSPVIAQFHSR